MRTVTLGLTALACTVALTATTATTATAEQRGQRNWNKAAGRRIPRPPPSRLCLSATLRTIRLLRRVLLRPVLLSSISVLLRSCSLLRVKCQLLVWVLSSNGAKPIDG